VSNLGFALDGAWRVLLAGLVLGAGLPILFTLGVRSLAWSAAGGQAARPLGRAAGYALFGVVVLGVLIGITFIVATGFGKTLSFEHLYPTIVSKH
jgi:hypothetical protein